MIVVKTEYYGENKEVVEKLVEVLNKAINNFCVEHRQEFIVLNNMSVIGIPTKVIE